MSKQVGELAKQVMIKERYYALEGDEPYVDLNVFAGTVEEWEQRFKEQ